MADVTTHVRWTGAGLQFVAGGAGKPHMLLDGNGAVAPSPVTTLLLALGGCTAADIIDISNKMRVSVGGLELVLEADRASEPPRRVTRIRMVYRVSGVAGSDRDKVQRAHDLSHEKYCSVLHSLRRDTEIESELEFVEE